MQRLTDEDRLVLLYNWAYEIYRAARPGGAVAAASLAVPDEQADEIDHAFAAIADAALVILRALSTDLPGAQGAPRKE